VTEELTCDECGEPIDPPESAVRMAQQVEDGPSPSGERRWRNGLVLHFHLNCAPRELVGVWSRVA
jgi:hypothetical protein